MRILSLLLLAFFVAACTSAPIEGPQANETATCYLNQSTVDCKPRPDMSAMKVADLAQAYAHEPWVKQKPGEPPLIGLALMGGGSQAGAFALGVIKRLVDSDTLGDVDLISSVSGGGYAALYLYSRAVFLDRALAPGTDEKKSKAVLKALFSHRNEICTGQGFEYRARTLDFPDHRLNDDLVACPGYFNAEDGRKLRDGSPVKDGFERLCQHAKDASEKFGAPSMFFLRCYQDLLAGHFGKATRTDNPPDWGKLGADTLGTILTAPFYFATNVAFDFQLPLSPSRYTYRTGIYRAFGHIPECWLLEGSRGAGDPELQNLKLEPACEGAFQHRSHQEFFAESRALNYEALARVAQGSTSLGKMPMWILNATTTTRPVWDYRTTDVAQMDKFRFEFTPFGFGGRRHGFVEQSPSKLDVDVMTALFASAGFVDPAQRIFGPVANGAVSIGTNLVGLDWSTAIPNYRKPYSARVATSAIPAPLHALTRFDEPSLRSNIHLGDGGISRETFGAVALIERGVRHIIISDHVDDLDPNAKLSTRTVQMHTLCNLARMLDMKGLQVRFFGHPEVSPQDDIKAEVVYAINSESCDSERGLQLRKTANSAKSALNYRHWRRPLWHGEVFCAEESKCKNSVANGVKLYLIKTAIDQEKFLEVNHCNPQSPADLSGRCSFMNSNVVARHQRANPDARPQVPPYLLGWWFDGATTSDSTQSAQYDSPFPQDSMFTMTADNSQSLFSAYLELGNYLAYDAVMEIRKIVKNR